MSKKMDKMYENFSEFLENEQDKEATEFYQKELLKKYGTNARCPHCNRYLLKSDLKEYTYVCLFCNENFYKFEGVI